jgi:hypothetical protein
MYHVAGLKSSKHRISHVFLHVFAFMEDGLHPANPLDSPGRAGLHAFGIRRQAL